MICLANNRKTDYTIVISASASPSISHAAHELKRFSKRSPARYNIALDCDLSPKAEEIIIGDNNHSRALDCGIDIESLETKDCISRPSAKRLS